MAQSMLAEDRWGGDEEEMRSLDNSRDCGVLMAGYGLFHFKWIPLGEIGYFSD